MWNGTATRATEKLHVGDCIEAVGRLQSREYIKDLGGKGKEPRRCYELSVNQYELQKKATKDNKTAARLSGNNLAALPYILYLLT